MSNFSLESTRLKKMCVDILKQPDQAGKGQLMLNYNVSSLDEMRPDVKTIMLRIEGSGISQNDPDDKAFTVDAELIGKFSVHEIAADESQDSAMIIDMANYLIPLLADNIETVFAKCGFPKMQLFRSLDYDSTNKNKVE
ncbi:MAG: hypothetical protein WAO71_13180 [Gallionella sp.]